MQVRFRVAGLCLLLPLLATAAFTQTITASLHGRVSDKSGAVLPLATITAVNTDTGFTRSAISDDNGSYELTQLPVRNYKVTVSALKFRPQTSSLQLVIGQTATLDSSLSPGDIKEEITVTTETPLIEATSTSVDSVIGDYQIQNLPVNGRQFIDFALLAPGVIVGDTTSGSTDVIIEPVTKLSFAGQNIHYNFIAVDGE